MSPFYHPPAPPRFTVHSLIVVTSIVLAVVACVLGNFFN